MILQANPDFRADPTKAIYLSGEINQALLDRLIPAFLDKQRVFGPLTVYIDSPGGNTFHAEMLQKMLAAGNQDFGTAPRIITVVTGFAASAAADLLVAGNYALAYEHATIMFHGVRQLADRSNLTHEGAASLAKNLATTNERYAFHLANNCKARFFFRITMLKDEMSSIRVGDEADADDVRCLILALKPKISHHLQILLWQAANQYLELKLLSFRSMDSVKAILPETESHRIAEFEAALFQSILTHELREHPEDDWSFTDNGFASLEEKFLLLVDQSSSRHRAEVKSLCERWGQFLLTSTEEIHLAEASVEARAHLRNEYFESHLRPLWFFFVAVCRALQKADYFFTAEEAYWLGFIDEVIGREDLPSPRFFAEYVPPTQPS